MHNDISGRVGPVRRGGGRAAGFTLVELLAACGVLAVLLVLLVPAAQRTRLQALSTASAANVHLLVAANLLYAADHGGQFCPAQDAANLHRWHGARTSIGAAFDPAKGYLSPYLEDGGWARICPVFLLYPQSTETFERGSGGYGYNAEYIGGTPESPFVPELQSRVHDPAHTIMFTDTALPRVDGIQEYPYCEPYFAVNANGSLGGQLNPSVQFRHEGYAHVGWCDGSVTCELPSQLGGVNLYGGDATLYDVGWLGPSANNGWWNPRR